MIKRGTAIFAAAVALAAIPSSAHAATQVPQGDWSYAAMQDLASKGLVDGYPKGAVLFGDRTVNRYEMATLITRVVDDITANPSATTNAAPQTLDEISKLVQAYGVELAVIGTDVANLKLGVASLTDTALDQQKQIDALKKTKVDSGFGTTKIGGLFQIWALDGNRDVTNIGSGPGTGLGLSAGTSAATTDSTLASTMRIRRAEVHLSGDIDPKSYWYVNFDPSKDQSITVKTPAVGAGAAASATNTTVVTNGTAALQDFYVGWHLTPKINFEAGQQKVPLSIEGYRSSGNLLTIERSLFNEVAYNAGKVGDQRDLGLWGRYTDPGKATAVVAVTDDAGNRQNLVDDNNGKELLLNGQIYPIAGLQAGAYGDVSGGTGPGYVQHHTAGYDFDYAKGKNELTGEYETTNYGGTKLNDRLDTQGAYVTYAYSINPKWQAVTKYDFFNPNQDLHNNEKDLTLGVNYNMDSTHSRIQFNYVRRDISGPTTLTNGYPAATALTSLGASRWVYITSFQQAF